MNNSDFVHTAIQDLLYRGLIVQCDKRPFVVNPLTVSFQYNLNRRMILDLRAVNKHLFEQSVTCEDIRTAQHHIILNYFMFKFDVHSAYPHVDIFNRTQSTFFSGSLMAVLHFTHFMFDQLVCVQLVFFLLNWLGRL